MAKQTFVQDGLLAGNIAQLVECLSILCKAWVPSSELHKPGMVVQACDPNTQEKEAGGSEIQSHPFLHSNF